MMASNPNHAAGDHSDTDSSVVRTALNHSSLEGLEFDGDTVLCRVCGDKASGFHYGVHACEGCKGFFRRSIQQKIQYRTCLKNQQCNIMRVNRNRCQYCRLKKCITVGMSRDAVRFGRVPKKEKAKIYEQMQKVNLQSHNWQLCSTFSDEAALVACIVDTHRNTCKFTRENFRAFYQTVWQNPRFVDCPAHLACPLNPMPHTQDSGLQQWEKFSECITPAISNVVSFAKSIPGFQVFGPEDQVTLLKAGTFEVLLLHLACLFDSYSNTMLFTNGMLYKRQASTESTNAGFLLNSMFDFAEQMNKLQLSDDEIALFSAVVMVAADRPGLRNANEVEIVQRTIALALEHMVQATHPDDRGLFKQLLQKIPDLRTLNALHSEKLLGMPVSQGGTTASNGVSTTAGSTACIAGLENNRIEVKKTERHEVWQPPVNHATSADKPRPAAPKENGIPIIPHRVAMDTTESEVVLQTPIGVFHRQSAPRQPPIPTVEVMDADTESPPECAGCESSQGRCTAQQACVETVLRRFASLQSHNSSGDSRSSSPEPLELDLPGAASDGKVVLKPDVVCVSDGGTAGRQPLGGDGTMVTPEDSYLDVPSKKEVDRMIYLKMQKFWQYEMRTRSRSFSSTNTESESRMQKFWENEIRSRSCSFGSHGMDAEIRSALQKQWDYDMRSSRSNSISSNTSNESVDSAYRTISSPGTPCSGYGDPRSPYTHDREKLSDLPTLKSALSMPPLIGQHLWFMGEDGKKARTSDHLRVPDYFDRPIERRQTCPESSMPRPKRMAVASKTSTPRPVASPENPVEKHPELFQRLTNGLSECGQHQEPKAWWAHSASIDASRPRSQSLGSRLMPRVPLPNRKEFLRRLLENDPPQQEVAPPDCGVPSESGNHCVPLQSGSTAVPSHQMTVSTLKDKILRRIDSQENVNRSNDQRNPPGVTYTDTKASLMNDASMTNTASQFVDQSQGAAFGGNMTINNKPQFAGPAPGGAFGVAPGYGPAMMSRLSYMPMAYPTMHPMFLLNQYNGLKQFNAPSPQQALVVEAAMSAVKAIHTGDASSLSPLNLKTSPPAVRVKAERV